MLLDKVSHCLSGVVNCPSPNFDDRPPDIVIDTVVLHNISLPPGEFGGCHVEALFTNCLDACAHPYFAEIHTLRVSSHVLIDRNGMVTQFVPFDKRAWHAGVSCHEGRTSCNDFSIGIELEGTDETAYTDCQYQCLVEMLRLLFSAYAGLDVQRLTGHSDISPGRKTDPGSSFDWNRLYRMLEQPKVLDD